MDPGLLEFPWFPLTPSGPGRRWLPWNRRVLEPRQIRWLRSSRWGHQYQRFLQFRWLPYFRMDLGLLVFRLNLLNQSDLLHRQNPSHRYFRRALGLLQIRWLPYFRMDPGLLVFRLNLLNPWDLLHRQNPSHRYFRRALGLLQFRWLPWNRRVLEHH